MKSNDLELNPSGNTGLESSFSIKRVNEEARITFDWISLLSVVISIQTSSCGFARPKKNAKSHT